MGCLCSHTHGCVCEESYFQVGLCMAHSRLCGHRVVRSTRPVIFVPPEFVPPRDQRTVEAQKNYRCGTDLVHWGSRASRHRLPGVPASQSICRNIQGTLSQLPPVNRHATRGRIRSSCGHTLNVCNGTQILCTAGDDRHTKRFG